MRFMMSLMVMTIWSVTVASAAQKKFITAYVDESGLRWSKVLTGLYTNGCDPATGTLCSNEILTGKDSPAQGACEKIGARLPTEDEFNEMIQTFDHVVRHTRIELTKTGLAQMEEAFKQRMNLMLWTSTIAHRSDVCQTFGATGGGFGNPANYAGSVYTTKRYNRFNVICVK